MFTLVAKKIAKKAKLETPGMLLLAALFFVFVSSNRPLKQTPYLLVIYQHQN